MRLTKFSIENYRSITDGRDIVFANQSILVGKNNEGKSNILHALNLAMEILQRYAHSSTAGRYRAGFPPVNSILSRGYKWERDFPISLQKKPNTKKVTSLTLNVELDDQEIEVFKTDIKSVTHQH